MSLSAKAFRKLLAMPATILMVTASGAMAQDYSPEEVEAFANALTRLQEIQSEATAELGQAGTVEEQTAIQQQAQKEMGQAIQAEGLTIQKYQEMGQALETNNQLWDQVRQHLEQQGS